MIPQALYFPYTSLSADRSARLLALVKEIILYCLPQEKPQAFLEAAVRAGRARFEEKSFFEDPAQAARLLADFNQWSVEFRDPAFLSVLKQRRREEQESETAARLAGQVRGYDAAQTQPDPNQEAQLFLSFLRLLERQQGEVESLLSEVNERDRRMASILGAELDEAEPSGGPGLSGSPGDLPAAFLLQRLLAWGRFYDAFGPDKIPLVTDLAETIELLDQNLARLYPTRPIEPGRALDALQPFVEADFGLPAGGFSLGEAEVLIEETAGPRQGAWGKLLARISEQPVASADLDALRREAAEAVADRPRPWTGNPAEQRLSLTGYLIPGASLKAGLREALGLVREAKPDAASTYVGPIFLVSA